MKNQVFKLLLLVSVATFMLSSVVFASGDRKSLGQEPTECAQIANNDRNLSSDPIEQGPDVSGASVLEN